MTNLLTWLGIVFCVSQSACFSGLNLAFFSLSRMQLEIESGQGDKQAEKILAMRQDSNFLLTTILWGNVAINVLLTLLSDSVLAGVSAFLFSTIAITLFGEIGPQAYFSRHAKKMAALLTPLLRFYQFLLYPVAKPCAMFLDLWLGKEGLHYLREKDLRAMIRKHIESGTAEVAAVEGIGALNFLAIDDLPASTEGEIINKESIIRLPMRADGLVIPQIRRDPEDPFLQQLNRSGHSWVVLTDHQDHPGLVVDADGLLRAALLNLDLAFDPYRYCHRPILILDDTEPLGDIMLRLKLSDSEDVAHDGALVKDVVLVWTPDLRKIITGADILGRLLKGINRYERAATASATAVQPPMPQQQ
jgi:CBS domain containing-hemolysin-like protein